MFALGRADHHRPQNLKHTRERQVEEAASRGPHCRSHVDHGTFFFGVEDAASKQRNRCPPAFRGHAAQPGGLPLSASLPVKKNGKRFAEKSFFWGICPPLKRVESAARKRSLRPRCALPRTAAARRIAVAACRFRIVSDWPGIAFSSLRSISLYALVPVVYVGHAATVK